MLLYAGISHDNLELVASSIQNEIDRIEKIVNRFDSGSELFFINNNASDKPCTISDELAEMIRECLIFNKKTFGCFNITVNSLNRFRSGIDNIHLDSENKIITFNHPDVQIDLNGYIKGYALRAIVQILRENNIPDALISMGNSSILAIGNYPQGEGWKIGLDTEYNKNNTEVTLFNECLTTSGNSSKNPRHIINPQTGEFVKKMDTVSVVTTDPALGEIFSTAFFVAGKYQWNVLEKKIVKFASLRFLNKTPVSACC
jgi:thiamine biosynthesis lipoprotein